MSSFFILKSSWLPFWHISFVCVCPRFRFLDEQSSDKTVATEPHKESIYAGRYAILVYRLIVVIILEY